MSEEPARYGTKRRLMERPTTLADLAKSLTAADYGDLVEGYGELSTESEVRLVRQIGRLVQQALELEGRG